MMSANQIPNDLKMGREYALLGRYVHPRPPPDKPQPPEYPLSLWSKHAAGCSVGVAGAEPEPGSGLRVPRAFGVVLLG